MYTLLQLLVHDCSYWLLLLYMGVSIMLHLRLCLSLANYILITLVASAFQKRQMRIYNNYLSDTRD